jgi:bacillithiol system protein YtxJ
MNWKELKALNQIDEITAESINKFVLIFKHSTRCNVSRMTMDRLERDWNDNGMPEVSLFYLDLLRFREISNAVAQAFNVYHQSPQILLISNGKSVLDLSHFDIRFESIKNSILKFSGLFSPNS